MSLNDISHRNRNRRKMAEAVANVARRINATVEEGKDYLGKNPFYTFSDPSNFYCILFYCSFSILMKSLFNTRVDAMSRLTSRGRQRTHHLLILFFFSTDLSNCKLISFPDGVFKVLRSVSEDIRVITLADNEMKVISSKFFSTFTNLRGAAQYTPIHLINLSIFFINCF